MTPDDEVENMSAAQRLKLRTILQTDGRRSVIRHNVASATELELERFEQMKISECTELLRF